MTERETRDALLHEIAAVTGSKLVYLRSTYRHHGAEELQQDLEAVLRVRSAMIDELMDLNPEFVRSALEILDHAALSVVREQFEFERELNEQLGLPSHEARQLA